jgi:hypothetical protein
MQTNKREESGYFSPDPLGVGPNGTATVSIINLK